MEPSDPAAVTTPEPSSPPPSEAAPEPKTMPGSGQRSALLIVFLVVFIDLLGWGIALPLLPRFAKEFLHDASGTTTGIVIGLLMSSFSAMQFFLAPVWGRLSDRLGRRPILLLGLFASVIFNALFGVASM